MINYDILYVAEPTWFLFCYIEISLWFFLYFYNFLVWECIDCGCQFSFHCCPKLNFFTQSLQPFSDIFHFYNFQRGGKKNSYLDKYIFILIDFNTNIDFHPFIFSLIFFLLPHSLLCRESCTHFMPSFIALPSPPVNSAQLIPAI